MLKPTFIPAITTSVSTGLEWPARFVSFAIIGALCTLAFTVVYAALRNLVLPLPANAIALAVTMGANFAGNRRFTFGAHDGQLLPQFGGYLVAYAAGLVMSSTALLIALQLFPDTSPAFETLLAVASGGFATLTRFVVQSAWVFRPHHPNAPEVPRG